MEDHRPIKGDQSYGFSCHIAAQAWSYCAKLVTAGLEKFARSVLRHIRVNSKHELKKRASSPMSTDTQSSTPGPISSPMPPDMIRTLKTLI